MRRNAQPGTNTISPVSRMPRLPIDVSLSWITVLRAGAEEINVGIGKQD